MRVTHNMIFGSSITNINSALSDVMRLNAMNSAQKQILSPSDNPAGYNQILNLRAYNTSLNQYQDNIDTARGWLNLADEMLLQASELITSSRELAEQAATGTLTADQRESLASQARQNLASMISIANTEYVEQSIFAGHKIGDNAYEQALGVTVNDENLTAGDIVSVVGEAEHTILIQTLDAGVVGTDTIDYRYSTDGGETWTQATLTAGDAVLDCGTAQLELAAGTTVQADGDTSFYLRPTAVYQGDTNDGVNITKNGAADISASADGVFAGDINVRIDSGTDINAAVEYSYSLDGGNTWVEGNVTSNARMPLPGGFLNLTSGAGTAIAAGDQFRITPSDADISVNINRYSEVVVNNVGLDIFGGLYDSDGDGTATEGLPDSPEENLFEAMGELIGYLEVNDTDGIAECLEKLKSAHERLETFAADVGARENRLDAQEDILETQKGNATSRLAGIEDADLSTLLVEIAKAESIYQSVLNSASRVMQLSLLNYL